MTQNHRLRKLIKKLINVNIYIQISEKKKHGSTQINIKAIVKTGNFKLLPLVNRTITYERKFIKYFHDKYNIKIVISA